MEINNNSNNDIVSCKRWSFINFCAYMETNSIQFKYHTCLLRGVFFFIRKPNIHPFGFYQSWALLFPLISNTYCQGAAIPLFMGQRSGSPLWFSRWSILPEDTLLADRINSLLIRLGPSIVFPFPALSSFINWNFKKP